MGQKQEKNLITYAYDKIKNKILNKEILPGAKLNQQDLAKELGISRTPIVKALLKLETEGLVDNISNQGFYVHRLTLKELYDLFLLRQALDSLIISDIINKIEQEVIENLRGIFKPFIGCEWNAINVQLYRKADKIFHISLLHLCENDLVKKINNYFQIYERTFHAGLVREPRITLEEHLAIINALENHDEEAALSIICEHTEKSRQTLKETIVRMKKLGYDISKMEVIDVSEIINKIK